MNAAQRATRTYIGWVQRNNRQDHHRRQQNDTINNINDNNSNNNAKIPSDRRETDFRIQPTLSFNPSERRSQLLAGVFYMTFNSRERHGTEVADHEGGRAVGVLDPILDLADVAHGGGEGHHQDRLGAVDHRLLPHL